MKCKTKNKIKIYSLNESSNKEENDNKIIKQNINIWENGFLITIGDDYPVLRDSTESSFRPLKQKQKQKTGVNQSYGNIYN